MRMEIRGADGGDDSLLFARDLADAIAKHSSTSYEVDGKIIVFYSL